MVIQLSLIDQQNFIKILFSLHFADLCPFNVFGVSFIYIEFDIFDFLFDDAYTKCTMDATATWK